jgi:gamma-glutamylaminecyclotransferase
METSFTTHRVFVYGTLKSSQPNHRHLESPNCHFVGSGCTELPFPLVIATRWNLPFLLYVPGKGQRVHGEVYDIDDRCLAWLDQFEEHPDFYEREQVWVYLHSRPEEAVECWVYFLKKFEPAMLDMEMMSCYDSFGTHNRPYLPENDDSNAVYIEDELRECCSAYPVQEVCEQANVYN